MKALYIASTGMAAQERNVEVISNNIANMRTTGYKRARAEFQDLLYQVQRQAGSTTSEGLITLQHAECQAACTEAPTLQVNYRHRYRVTNDEFDRLIDDLRAGRLDDEIPSHGTLARNRQHIPADKAVGAVPPEDVTSAPAWIEVAPS